MTTPSKPLFLLLGAVLLLVAAPALAEDAPPPYGASDLALEDEGLAEGWEIVYDELEGTPGEALETWAMDAATGAGHDEDDVLTEIRILQGPDGVAATIVVVEVDGDAKGLEKAMALRGKSLGYAVSQLGHPSRLLVVAAPDAVRSKVEAMQREYAVRILSQLGWERLRAGSLVGARDYGLGARKIDPKAGSPVVLLGMVATKAEKWDDAIEAFRAGFGQSTTIRPKGRFAMRAYAHYGYAAMQKKTTEFDKMARDAFEKCIALESHADDEDPKFIQRYNYACALARLNQRDEACEQLEMAFMYQKRRMGANGVKMWIQQHVLPDDDLKSLRGNATYEALLKKFTGGGGMTSGGLEGL